MRETNIRYDTSVILERSSGVLLHPTSLPGGGLGPEAYRFVDWLAAAGQSWWQMLPLGPPDEFRSPYNSISAFAASGALLDAPRAKVTAEELDEFSRRQAYWLGDYAAVAGPDAAAVQLRFEREWQALRTYAADRGIRLIGDVPMFVSRDSVDVGAHPRLFRRGVVAGAPPDYFNRTGQLWGSALYDWQALRRTGYRWWIERFRRTFELVDAARLDHFRGFVAAWTVPERNATAVKGHWARGPGLALFRAAEAELGRLPLIAEDLGRITEPVERLRETLELPGIRVLQFAFGGSARNPHRLENLTEECLVTTGTHDNDTVVGWWRSLGDKARAATGLDPAEPHWALISLALQAPSQLAVVPAQDILGLGSEARMNIPGRIEGNWTWRLRRGQLTDELARRLRRETESAGRLRA